LPVLDPSELNAIGKTVLCVVPVERDADVYTQGGLQKNNLAIDVCVNAALDHRNDDEPDALTEEIDSLIALAEKVYSAFLKKVVKNAADGFKATFMEPEHFILHSPDIIQDRNCFLSVVRVNALVFAKPEV
jgi:hypothetical protein